MSSSEEISIKQIIEPYKDAIKNSLPDKKLVCPMCKGTKFMVVDALGLTSLQTSTNAIVIGGPSLRSVVLVCSNCGFISQHLTDVLFKNNASKKGAEE